MEGINPNFSGRFLGVVLLLLNFRELVETVGGVAYGTVLVGGQMLLTQIVELFVGFVRRQKGTRSIRATLSQEQAVVKTRNLGLEAFYQCTQGLMLS